MFIVADLVSLRYRRTIQAAIYVVMKFDLAAIIFPLTSTTGLLVWRVYGYLSGNLLPFANEQKMISLTFVISRYLSCPFWHAIAGQNVSQSEVLSFSLSPRKSILAYRSAWNKIFGVLKKGAKFDYCVFTEIRFPGTVKPVLSGHSIIDKKDLNNKW